MMTPHKYKNEADHKHFLDGLRKTGWEGWSATVRRQLPSFRMSEFGYKRRFRPRRCHVRYTPENGLSGWQRQ